MATHTDAIILGAGISGLTTGFYLAEKGLRVRILEKSPRVGGDAKFLEKLPEQRRRFEDGIRPELDEESLPPLAADRA
ncbi:MAG: FAD-dependent oxidoreductase, partial [Spartobacteria bacterium]